MLTELDAHDRRRQRDREDQARRRAEARATGEPMGHALDSIVIDGLQLLLAGRDMTDPIRLAWTHALTRAIHARRKQPTAALARRLQARLAISSSLETALIERRIAAIEDERDGRV